MPRTTTSRTQKPKRRKARPSPSADGPRGSGLHCLHDELAKPRVPYAFGMALMLRMAIGHSFLCPEPACSRRQICAKPVLECTLRHRADDYDWDAGWYYCQRKELYGQERYDGMPAIRGGTDEVMEKQKQALRDMYDANTWEM
jgi:hypothetical protein